MSGISFTDRVKGCLVGSVIGAELGYARVFAPDMFKVNSPMEMFDLKLEPVREVKEDHRLDHAKLTPFVDLGVRSYLQKNGRVTPEDFAALMKDDPGVSTPAFWWDNIHGTQELLKEGMHPRISGFGNVPCGIIAASMPAVGIYHAADSEYAYLDGVELASVTQPRVGADWAALAAVAVAAAFDCDSTAESVMQAVLSLAFENNKDLFYEMNAPLKAVWPSLPEENFVTQWYLNGPIRSHVNQKMYMPYNPIAQLLPLLKFYGADLRKVMAMLLVPDQFGVNPAAVVAGAVIGALVGLEGLPAEWREWAEPQAEGWYPIQQVVETRLAREKEVVSVMDRLLEPDSNGDTLLFDKVYGCVLAGAIGNAMGSPVEGQLYWEIDGKHPGGVQTILNPAALENEDDNQMAMMLIETYLAREGRPVMARHFGETWKDRMNRDKFFVNCMGSRYDMIQSGWDPRITGHWAQVTGSTVMCMEPVGIYHIADPDYAWIDAMAVSYMYQRGLDVTVATILSAIVADAFRPEATVTSVCDTALAAAPTSKMFTFDERPFYSARDYLEVCLEVADKYDDVFAARKELYEKCLLYHQIDPLELFGLSLAMLKISNGDIRQAAVGGTNIGRDSDTIAGRAAMLSGILNGSAGVPADWMAMFAPRVLEKIRTNCGRLIDTLKKKNERVRQRSVNL